MNIKDKMKYGYTYLIYSVDIHNVPLEADFLEIQDEEGIGTGEYYSFAMLSALLGKAFTPVPYINEGFLLAHLPLELGEDSNGNNDQKDLAKELKKIGTDMRQGLKKSEDIDFDNLDSESYGFFSASEIQSVPKYIAPDFIIDPITP